MIWGIPFGYGGFYSGFETSNNVYSGWTRLTSSVVDQIHTQGGSFLGTSRGGHDTNKIVDAFAHSGVNMVFVVGGDGTLRGGSVLAEDIQRRGLQISIIGVPKTVDNDIPIIDKSFGFQSAVDEAQRSITAANVEARSLQNGIGIVQLMGRNSGFVALHAALGSRDVDCVLIPEINFALEGPTGLFSYIEKRLREKGHVLLVVAEGAGQEHIAKESSNNISNKRDASGNAILDDVGSWLIAKVRIISLCPQRINAFNFGEIEFHQVKNNFKNHPSVNPSIKFVNPTYMLRSIAPNAADSIFCTALAHSAVHGAFNGLTNFVPGPINSQMAYIPLDLIFGSINVVSVDNEVRKSLAV